MRPIRHRRTPLSCDQVQEAISARVDHEPVDVARSLLDAHLAGCGPCRMFAEVWQGEGAVLTRALVIGRPRQPPAALTTSVLSVARSEHRPAVAPSRRRDRRPGRTTAWVASAVPIVVAAALLAVPVSGHHAPTRPPTPCTMHLHHR